MSAAQDAAIAEQVKRERHERTLKLRDQWDAWYAEWLTNRAVIATGGTEDWDESAHMDRETELARLITTTPAVYPWMILQKLEVLEHYLGSSDGTSWLDNREVVMLAGIKADLLRFEPQEVDD